MWPSEGEGGDYDEPSRVRAYLESTDAARARGLLEYEGWEHLSVDPGDGGMSVISLKNDWFDLDGQAGVEKGYTYYLRAGMN